jgi:hypothetical protein
MDAVKRLNKQYSQVKIGGHYRFYDGEDFLTLPDFVLGEKGRGQMIGEKSKEKFVADTAIWLNSEDRNLYRKCIFYPGSVPMDTFNLWTGFQVKPAQGGYDLFKRHLFENVCNGRKDYFTWIWQWFAQIMQHPEEKLGSALVLKGDKGSGKSIIFDIMGKLIGRAYTKLSQESQIIGRFNGALEGKILVCLEEAMWAGNKAGGGVMKDLITAPTLRIERKGLESYDSPSFVRIGIATNADWAVPVSQDERRFMVLGVGNGWQKNTKIFGAMIKQMDSGGYAALMYDLMHTRLDPRIDLRNPPVTEALKDQVARSEPVYVSFWREYVERQELDWDKIGWLDDIEPDMIRYCQAHDYSKPLVRRFYIPHLKKLGIISESKRLRDPSTQKRGTRLTFNPGHRTEGGQLET